MTTEARPRSNCIVVSQPMYFPWMGMLQQIALADVFAYYDDVDFSRGFFNRVQIKSALGSPWLTVPLSNRRRGQLINEVLIDNSSNWKRSHLDQLRQAYRDAPFRREMLAVVEEVFSCDFRTLSELSMASMNVLVSYFKGLSDGKRFVRTSSLGVFGASSQRLIDICLALKGNEYLTGHGARNYLDHSSFDEHGIAVFYADYVLDRYPQLHGDFTPYVSALDLIANCGSGGISFLKGRRVPWRQFVTGHVG